MGINSQRYNVYTKNGFLLDEKGSNIGTIFSFTHHKQDLFSGPPIVVVKNSGGFLFNGPS